ncbi:MAG: glycosyltransferase [Planctomycetota bacterium]
MIEPARTTLPGGAAARDVAARWPVVSVVMPVRNEVGSIDGVVRSLLGQEYPRDRLEILIADGRSTDGTRERIAKMAAQDPLLRLIDNPGLVVPTALNLAIARAHGSIIVRADGHARYAPDYVRRAVEALEMTGADVVGGPMVPRGKSAFGRAVAAALTSPVAAGGSAFHFAERRGEVESVYLGVFRKEALGRFGAFDEFFTRNQDDEWFYRARSQGARVVLDPAIQSVYQPRESCRALLRQYLGYGFYKPAVLKKVPSGLRLRHLAPPALVASLVLLAVAAPLGLALRTALLVLLGAYLAVLAAGAWCASRRDAGAAVWRVMLAIATMHLGYGLGFLAGSLRRASRGDLEALRGVYRGYRDDARRQQDWSAACAGQAHLLDERDRAIGEALGLKFGASLASRCILDVGAGARNLQADLARLGFAAPRVVAIDLLRERLAENTNTRRVVADARYLPFREGSFDAAVQCTMLSSIPVHASRCIVAAEMRRIARLDGLVLSYDARWPNPFNSRVRRVSRWEHERLFAGARVAFRALTTVPPLARRAPALARMLGRWRPLCAFDLAIVDLARRQGDLA